MSDNEYIKYAKEVHGEIHALSNPMIDSIANKVLTRLCKEQKFARLPTRHFSGAPFPDFVNAPPMLEIIGKKPIKSGICEVFLR